MSSSKWKSVRGWGVLNLRHCDALEFLRSRTSRAEMKSNCEVDSLTLPNKTFWDSSTSSTAPFRG